MTSKQPILSDCKVSAPGVLAGPECHLQFITHYNDRYSYLDSVRIALAGGCRWVQLRMKGAEESLLEKTAIAAQRLCKEYGATFIIDDNDKSRSVLLA